MQRNIERESIRIACTYAMKSNEREPVVRAEFLAQWPEALRRTAEEVWDEVHNLQKEEDTSPASIILQHLASIGARPIIPAIAGPNGSSLRWFAMENHVVIFQAFKGGERWEIYTSMSAGNKVLLSDACSALTSLVMA